MLLLRDPVIASAAVVYALICAGSFAASRVRPISTAVVAGVAARYCISFRTRGTKGTLEPKKPKKPKEPKEPKEP
jgi:hypothetical protein